MGQYLDRDGLLRRLSPESMEQLTDDAAAGAEDAYRVEEAIADAEAEVDAYLQERYTLPLAQVPALLVRLTADLATWHLYGRRQLADDAVNARHKEAVKLLERLASGEVSLGVAQPPAEVGGGAQTAVTPEGRAFTRGTLRGF